MTFWGQVMKPDRLERLIVLIAGVLLLGFLMIFESVKYGRVDPQLVSILGGVGGFAYVRHATSKKDDEDDKGDGGR